MKGIIIYSSKTGNTKRLAEYLYHAFEGRHELTLCSIDDYKQYKKENFDFALVGGWVHRAMPDKKVQKLLKKAAFPKLGLFVTLAAPPESDHGQEVRENLKRLLEGQDSLGYALLPGPVDPKVMDVISRKRKRDRRWCASE